MGNKLYAVSIITNRLEFCFPFHQVFCILPRHVVVYTMIHSTRSLPPVSDDVTTYTTLIADVQEVHEESSDFELPETVVA